MGSSALSIFGSGSRYFCGNAMKIENAEEAIMPRMAQVWDDGLPDLSG